MEVPLNLIYSAQKSMKIRGQINWGMIGCGDVTEKKSAPAFNLIPKSSLAGVSSRTKQKALSYAGRHGVPKVYDTAEQLVADPLIQAVYVATPPSSHAQYAIMAMRAGKPVYVEKPMASSYADCLRMNEVSMETGIPIFVAYYRRSMEYFLKVRDLLDSDAIGKPCLCTSSLHQVPRKEDYLRDDPPWRVIPSISGGGYFHDMGCHELDILMFLFGDPRSAEGCGTNIGGLYEPEDTVVAAIEFASGVLYSGSWCFVASPESARDEIQVVGASGSLRFSCFAFTPIELETESGKMSFDIPPPEPVQMPMIRSVVKELQGKGSSPSHGDSGARVNWLMERISGRGSGETGRSRQ